MTDLKFEFNLIPFHMRLVHKRPRTFTSFIVFGISTAPMFKQIIFSFLGFYLIVGKTMPIRPAPLSAEDRARLLKLEKNGKD